MDAIPAETPLETLFVRYRETGRPELLAAVFDRAAPALLRLAVHLVRDTGEAEDLVQATFLGAIERAGTYDARRPLEAWLTGILENQALAAHRRRRRAPDGGRVRERAAPRTPAELAELAELGGRLERALDALPEPYRRPCVLRFLHGLEPAAIAHALDRAPGTVRVQLHRGLELLKKSLPAGFAASLALLLSPARGLGAVRDAVVAQAGTVSVAATAAVTTGGVLVTKKLLGAAAAAALLLAAWLGTTLLQGEPVAPVETAAEPALAAAAAPREPEPPADPARLDSAEIAEVAPAAPERVPEAAAPPDPESTTPLRGRVTRGDTGAPVPDVAIELFGARAMTLAEIERRFGDVLAHQLDGRPISQVEWLAIPWELGPRERLRGAPIDVLAPPERESEPLARTRTGADGRFTLALPAAGGVLRIVHERFAERVVAVHEPPDAGALEVVLWPEARLAGRVVDPDGRPLERPITLHLCAADHADAWTVRTDAAGRFATSASGPRLRAWALVDLDVEDPRRPERELWVFPDELVPSAEPAAEQLLRPWRQVPPALHVTDAATGAPIESVRLRSFGEQGMVRYCGRFPAPEGWLFAYGSARPFVRLLSYEWMLQRDGRVEIDVWSEGYRPERVVLELAGPGERIAHVALKRGAAPRLEGWVTDGGAPVEGAEVTLAPFRPLGWRPEDAGAVALELVTTPRDGSFAFSAPEGEYLLRVTLGAETWVRRVHLPSLEPVFVDLDRFARITVRIEDPDGRPAVDHPAMVVGADERQVSARTDADGRLVLDRLPPGPTLLAWPWRRPGPSWGPDERRDLELQPGERRVETIVLPGGAEPVHARLVLPDETAPDFAGWRARVGWATDERPWHAVEPDGVVPIDVRRGARALEIDAPDGRRWYRSVPPDPPREVELVLRTAGPGYAGRLVDLATGAPLRAHRVFARETREEGTVAASALTDADGRFRIEGLAEAEHRLTFHHQADSTLGMTTHSRLNGVTFTPNLAPAEPPLRLDLRLPRLDGVDGPFRGLRAVVVEGVARGAAGAPIVGAMVSVSSLRSLPEGELRLWRAGGSGRTASDGTYRVSVPAGERYQLWLNPPGDGAAVRVVWEATGAGGPVRRDVVVE